MWTIWYVLSRNLKESTVNNSDVTPGVDCIADDPGVGFTDARGQSHQRRRHHLRLLYVFRLHSVVGIRYILWWGRLTRFAYQLSLLLVRPCRSQIPRPKWKLWHRVRVNCCLPFRPWVRTSCLYSLLALQQQLLYAALFKLVLSDRTCSYRACICSSMVD